MNIGSEVAGRRGLSFFVGRRYPPCDTLNFIRLRSVSLFVELRCVGSGDCFVRSESGVGIVEVI